MKKTAFIFFAACLVLTACMDRKGSPKGEPAPAGLSTDSRDTGSAGSRLTEGMTFIDGGQYTSVIDRDTQLVEILPFYIDKLTVTIRQFARFVEETGYIPQTDQPGSNTMVLTSTKIESMTGVNWKCDERGRPRDTADYDYPVVYVSYEDAMAYAAWAGKRLPTIFEWEYIALTGIQSMAPTEFVRMNAWHANNSRKIMKPGLKEPNDYGIYDLYGNVDEIVSLKGYSYKRPPEFFKPEDTRRSARSSFFTEPQSMLPPVFTVGHIKGTGFSMGFRCACDFKKEIP